MRDEGEAPGASADAWALARGLLRPHRGVLLLALALMLAQSAATLAQPWLGGVLTDRLLLGSGVAPLLWLLFGLIVAQQALGYLVSIQLQDVSGRLVANAGSHVYAHLQSLRRMADNLEPGFKTLSAADAKFGQHASNLRSTLDGALAAPPSSCDGLKKVMAQIGDGCKTCHQDFRK